MQKYTSTNIKITYTKAWQTYDGQLSLIREKGLDIDVDGIHYLKKIGYYRLSGYWYPFREKDPTNFKQNKENFQNGVRLSDVVDLYYFDKKLRLIVLDGIETIEIALRSNICLLYGADPFFYLNQDYFSKNFKEWHESFKKICKQSKAEWFLNAQDKYTKLPIWIVVDLWDFGLLKNFYLNLKDDYQKKIAEIYGIDKYVLGNGLGGIKDIRNICAHHERLWNANLANRIGQKEFNKIGDKVGYPHEESIYEKSNRNIYPILAIMQMLLKKIDANEEWGQKIKNHCLKEFPKNSFISLESSGFPSGWENAEIWQ